jgi:hypothetical protein
MPLSALITPATLGVAPKPNTKLFNLSVNLPSISIHDYDISNPYSPTYSELGRMITTLASTGELLRLSAPQGMQNMSYKLDLIVPIVGCLPSNDTVRAWTAAAAYEAFAGPWTAMLDAGEAVQENGYQMIPTFSDVALHVQNLTFGVTELIPMIDNSTGSAVTSTVTRKHRGQFGYYGHAWQYEHHDQPWLDDGLLDRHCKP